MRVDKNWVSSFTIIVWTLVTSSTIGQVGGHVIKTIDVKPEVQEISTAYFHERGDVVAYEASAKLVFRVQLPFLEELPFHESNSPYTNHTLNLVQKTTSALVQGFWSHINGLETRRRKRQLVVGGALLAGAFIGYEVHSVWTKLSKAFTGSENDAEENLLRGKIGSPCIFSVCFKLKSRLATIQPEHLMFVHNITGFSHNLTSTVNNLVTESEELARIDLWLLHLVQTHIGVTRVESGMDRCIDKMIPFQILPAKEVEAKLLAIKTSLASTGYDLAVPFRELIKDERFRIANCYVTDRNIYVLINVPIRKVQWKIVEMIPVPFANMNSTCSLENMEPKTIAVSRDKIVVAENFPSSCNIRTDKMCLVPTFSHPSVESIDCTSYLYQNASFEKLKEHCKFKCVESVQMTISELDVSTIIITFAKRISITCPGKKTNFKIPPFGSVQMTIKCNCTYVVDGEPLDSTGICIEEQFQANDVSVLVPYFVNDPEGEFLSSKHTTKWIDLVADVYLNTSENQDDYYTISGFHYRDFWLGVISVLGALLIVCVAIIAYCVK